MKPCHSSCILFASQCGGLDTLPGQSVWDLSLFSSEYFSFPLLVIPPILHILLTSLLSHMTDLISWHNIKTSVATLGIISEVTLV